MDQCCQLVKANSIQGYVVQLFNDARLSDFFVGALILHIMQPFLLLLFVIDRYSC